MLDDDLITQLPQDSDLALGEICDRFVAFCGSLQEGGALARYDHFIDFFAFLQAYAESQGMNLGCPSLKTEKAENIALIIAFFRRLKAATDAKVQKKQAAAALDAAKLRFARKFDEQRRSQYTLSEGDLLRLQRLLEAVRVRIPEIEGLSREFRERLGKKLDRTRRELQKSVPDFDSIWGLLPEAGVLHEKLGEQATPLLERLFEAFTIAWATQARSEELPSNTELPFLVMPEAEEENEAPEVIRAVRHRH
jgi:hypothetical protein